MKVIAFQIMLIFRGNLSTTSKFVRSALSEDASLVRTKSGRSLSDFENFTFQSVTDAATSSFTFLYFRLFVTLPVINTAAETW